MKQIPLTKEIAKGLEPGTRLIPNILGGSETYITYIQTIDDSHIWAWDTRRKLAERYQTQDLSLDPASEAGILARIADDERLQGLAKWFPGHVFSAAYGGYFYEIPVRRRGPISAGGSTEDEVLAALSVELEKFEEKQKGGEPCTGE